MADSDPDVSIEQVRTHFAKYRRNLESLAETLEAAATQAEESIKGLRKVHEQQAELANRQAQSLEKGEAEWKEATQRAQAGLEEARKNAETALEKTQERLQAALHALEAHAARTTKPPGMAALERKVYEQGVLVKWMVAAFVFVTVAIAVLAMMAR